MLDVLDPKKDAAAAEQVVDHATGDLKDLVDHFFAKLSEFCETHEISITKKENQ